LGICLFLFLAKLLATSFTFGMGGVGGLFVPSATIGAGLGAACDILFHPSQPGLFTLVGIAAFTGASYNSLLFSAVFIAEASGSPALVVPGLLASSTAFLVTAGVSNSQSQRSGRFTEAKHMETSACAAWMTRRIRIARPEETLLEVRERVFARTGLRSLPVIGEDGAFLGMVSAAAMRELDEFELESRTVEDALERKSRFAIPSTPMLEVERIFTELRIDYLPVIDPISEKLLGILSPTDVLRARHKLGGTMDEE
jgi:CIC family chloride channel protein